MCGALDLPAEDVLDALSGLVDRSLVVMSEVAASARYGLLEPVRQFAQGLMADDERAAVGARHASGYLALAEHGAVAGRESRGVPSGGRLRSNVLDVEFLA